MAKFNNSAKSTPMKCMQPVIIHFRNNSDALCAYEMTNQKPMLMTNVMES